MHLLNRIESVIIQSSQVKSKCVVNVSDSTEAVSRHTGQRKHAIKWSLKNRLEGMRECPRTGAEVLRTGAGCVLPRLNDYLFLSIILGKNLTYGIKFDGDKSENKT